MRLRFCDGNHLALLNSGREYFPALHAALLAARVEIFLETYVFAGDATASAVVDHLCAAAARGVRVHVLVDGFGARDMPAVYRTRLQRSGVQLLDYRRPVLWRPLRGLRRMHRKLVVIDAFAAGATALVGGINLIDDWNTSDEVAPRFDYAVQVHGPLVRDIAAAARHLWRITALRQLRTPGPDPVRTPPRGDPLPTMGPVPPAPMLPPVPMPPLASAGMRAALAVRDNLLHRTEIEDAYLAAIRSARSHITLACGYFLPSRRFLRALRTAAQRGVTVTVLLQGPSDHPLMKAASQSLYRQLQTAGISVVEYTRSFLHAKVAVIDDAWATVGSSNIDPFSLLLSREANVVVQDAGFATALRLSLERAIEEGGTRLSAEALARSGWAARAMQWLAYRFARMMVDLVAPGGARKLA